MQIPYYHIDAFTDKPFAGNPAGVCFLEQWLDTSTMQKIAAEHCLSETAFLVGHGSHYELRWFTPAVEVDLCGHGTLASAFTVFLERRPDTDTLTFTTQSGLLTVRHQEDKLEMDLPARPGQSCAIPEGLETAMGISPIETYLARDLMAVVETEQQVRNLQPDFNLIRQLPGFALIVTAPGEQCDFVSRFFAPQEGIDEDPVTGSAHCTLAPYWSTRLKQNLLNARQISARGGELTCTVQPQTITIAGKAVLYMAGTITI